MTGFRRNECVIRRDALLLLAGKKFFHPSADAQLHGLRKP